MGGWVDGRVRVYEAHEVKKRGEKYAVFYFAGFFLKFCSKVIVKQKKRKFSTYHYSLSHTHTNLYPARLPRRCWYVT